MREHTFRAWDKKQKVMYPLVDVHICTDKTYVSLAGTSQHGRIVTPSDADIELTEYIGIKDRYQHKIFEGDIVVVRFGRHILEVRWSVIGFRFYNHAQQQWHLLYVSDMQQLEVIGNIWENADLISNSTQETQEERK